MDGERRGSKHRRRPSGVESLFSPGSPRGRIPSHSTPTLAPRTPLSFIRTLVGAQEVPEDAVEDEPARPEAQRRQRSHSQSSTPTSELDRAYGVDADDFLAPDDLMLGPPMLDLPSVPEHPTTSDQPHHLAFVEPIAPHTITPSRHRRRRSSIASHDTAASSASRGPAFGRNALRMFKTLTLQPRSEGQRSTASVGSSDSSSTLHWRFWRGSSSSGSTRSDGDFAVIDTPTPAAYTLVLPDLHQNTVKPFERIDCDGMAQALDRLKAFWDMRGQSTNPDPVSSVSTLMPIPLSATTIRSPVSALERAASAPNIFGMLAAPPALPRRLTGPPVIKAKPRPREHDGPSWWLDVQCPTPRDMRALRKLLPLHPLTMEDILQQDMREKSEIFEALGYQFVVFRALDEKVFRLEQSSDPSLVKTPSDQSKDSRDAMLGKETDEMEMSELPKTHHAIDMLWRRGRRKPAPGPAEPRVSINPDAKEGLEGLGVGGVNVYLIIFEDGVVSFHFDPLDKHTDRVFSKIMQYGASRTISPHWIAYGLMDSIVDAFFPMLSFIERETQDISDYLSDPLGPDHEPHPLYRALDGDRRTFTGTLLAILPTRLAVRLRRSQGDQRTHRPDMQTVLNLVRHRFDQKSFLRRIAEARKLISGILRLLMSKTDAVKGLRKRVRDVKQYDRLNDVSIYYGDLLDHIVTLHQSLIYYDAQLAHDHPVYTGVLRVSLERAKQKVDHQIVRLYIVTLIFIPVVSVTGLFSMNVNRPQNGDADHLDINGNPAGFSWFGAVIGILAIVMLSLGLTVATIFRASRRKFAKKHFLETL